MSPTCQQEFITKKEVEELFGRSHRALTRDISTAVRINDTETLTHLKLRTENGQEYAGANVTLELIQQLSNSGLSPTWYIRHTFANERYGSRSKGKVVGPNQSRAQTSKPETPPSVENASQPTDGELVQVLKDQLKKSQDAHESDKKAFRDQLQMLKDMFDTLKDDHNDTKDLLKEVHKVMDKLADIRLLGATTSTSNVENAKPASNEPSTSSHSQPIVDATVLKASKSSQPAEPAQPKAVRTTPRKSAPKTGSASTKSTPTKNKPQSKGRAKVASTTPKQPKKTKPTKKHPVDKKNKRASQPASDHKHSAAKSRWYEKMTRFLSSDD